MTWRRIAAASIVLSLTLFLALLLMEGAVRVFYPDTELRYKTDSIALWYFAPGQTGTGRLADGSVTPPMRINALGLRGAEVDTSRKTVLMLGDSFTFGSGVADHETFSARLESMLPADYQVVNAGQPGYGLFQMEATLRRVAPVVRPAATLVVIWQGDFLRRPPTPAERELYFKRKRLSELLKRSTLVTHIYRAAERIAASLAGSDAVLRVGDLTRTDLVGVSLLDQHVAGAREDLTSLTAIDSLSRTTGQPAIVVLWPREGFATINPADVGLADSLMGVLTDYASHNGARVASLKEYLSGFPAGSLLIPIDAHPNQYGHCVVAKYLAGVLADQGLPADSSRVHCTP